jgi:hypothetical protein
MSHVETDGHRDVDSSKYLNSSSLEATPEIRPFLITISATCTGVTSAHSCKIDRPVK